MNKSVDIVPPHISRSIDIIRGAAALGVIWGHSISSTSKLPIQLNGAFWVWIFFSISGYLVGRGFIGGSYALSLSGFRRFLTNRALRIIPLAYTALAIGVMLNYINGTEIPITALSQFLFASPLNDMSLSGPLWSVAAEIQFYLAACFLVPLVCLVFRRGGGVASAILFCSLLWLVYLMIPWVGDNYVQPRTLIGNIEFFVFGLICANIKPIQIFYGRLIKALVVLSAIACAWWLNNYDLGRFWGPGVYNFPLGGGQLAALVVSAAILLINAESRWEKADMFFSQFQWCGFYCYGIYVWHSVMGSVGSLWKINGDLDRFVVLMLAIPLAPLSYKYIEKPMLSFRIGGRNSRASS